MNTQQNVTDRSINVNQLWNSSHFTFFSSTLRKFLLVHVARRRLRDRHDFALRFFLLLLVDAPRRADESTKMRELHTHETHNTLGRAASTKCKSSRRWEENSRQTAIIMMNCIIGFLFHSPCRAACYVLAHQGSESVQCLKTETSNKYKRKWTGMRGELNEWSEYLCDFALVSLKFFIWLRAPHTCLRSKSTLNVKRYFFISLNIVFSTHNFGWPVVCFVSLFFYYFMRFFFLMHNTTQPRSRRNDSRISLIIKSKWIANDNAHNECKCDEEWRYFREIDRTIKYGVPVAGDCEVNWKKAEMLRKT